MGEPLSLHTTLRLGGPAGQLLTHTAPRAWPDIAATLRGAAPPFVLGGGSNTLVPDDGHPGTTIRMATRGITRRTDDHGTELVVEAGEPLDELVSATVVMGLSGIEYLGGIPGTAGAAPVQNTGAYGRQISDALTSVTAFDWVLRRIITLTPADCAFTYRGSVFKKHPGRWTILTITLRLTPNRLAAPVTHTHLAALLDVPRGTRPPLAEAARAVLTDRRERGLALPGNGPDARQAGSVFLNPTVTFAQAEAIRVEGGPVHRDHGGSLRASAGWLLERSGYRPGAQVAPGVHCSTRRTLTLTARDGATSTAFEEALRTMACAVYRVSHVRLTPEPVKPPRPGPAANSPDRSGRLDPPGVSPPGRTARTPPTRRP